MTSNGLVYQTGLTPYGVVVVVKSKFARKDGTCPIAVWHHGQGGYAWSDGATPPAAGTMDPSQTGINDSPVQRSIIETLAGEGYVVVTGDFSATGTGPGTGWGSDANQAGIAAAVMSARGFGGSSTKKILLGGISMGAGVVLGYAGRYPSLVAGVIATLPACNISAYNGTVGITPDPGSPKSFASAINAAYGGNYTDATYGINHNPQYMADSGSAFAGMPIQLWHGGDDPLAPIALVTEFFNVVRGGSNPQITKTLIPGSGDGTNLRNAIHADSTLAGISLQKLISFAKTVLPPY